MAPPVTVICSFRADESDDYPNGEYTLSAQEHKFTLAWPRGPIRRKSFALLFDITSRDVDFLIDWLEAWERARVCAKYLRGTTAPQYKVTANDDVDSAHLNAVRASVLAAMQKSTAPTNASVLTLNRVDSNTLSKPPNADQITDIVLTLIKYRWMFYTPTDKSTQLGGMTPRWVIPEEIHRDTNQYFLVKSGHGWLIVDGEVVELHQCSAQQVYKGQSHAVVNDVGNPLHLFVTYSPSHHPVGRTNEINVDVLESK